MLSVVHWAFIRTNHLLLLWVKLILAVVYGVLNTQIFKVVIHIMIHEIILNVTNGGCNIILTDS